MRPIDIETSKRSVVCLSLCLSACICVRLEILVNSAKMAESVEMLYGNLNRVSPRNQHVLVLDRVQISHGRGHC